MSYKVSESDRNGRTEVKIKTKDKKAGPESFNWFKASSKKELCESLIETANYLKDNQQYRFRQASIHARLYGNLPLSNFAGSNLNKLSGAQNNLPVDRPTMNVVQSCIDTLCSRLTQSRPRPIFLTDNGSYKNRTLAKQMNSFINGEIYQTDGYEKAESVLRDAAILGTGCLHIFRDADDKVKTERVLATELFVDPNDAFYGNPRSMYRLKLVDRAVLLANNPEYKSEINKAEQGFPDNGGESSQTTADQIIVVEAWHLPSSKNANDGRHVIACSAGILLDEEYKRDDFPFVFLHYSPRMVGFWAQGLTEQLTGTQIEINKLLHTISQSISLVGVPRVFVEDGSKVVKSHLNNSIGAIVTYRGTKPEYTVAPSVHPELYQQLQRLIDYAYQQSGISALSATSQKPAGLNSGEAIRNYDDLQSDRFATLSKRYDRFFIDMAYKILDIAMDIVEETGKYETVYPDKDGTREINLPKIDKIKNNPFVIQCFDSSSLPRDPAGRLQTVTELMQAGIIDPQEGRRLLSFPDLEQVNKLANAPEERILKQLDNIVEEGSYEPPDPFTNIQLGLKLVNEYYNLYVACGLEESKAELLREYQAQLISMQQAMMPPQPQMGAAPIGVPEAPPTNELMPIQ